MADALAGLDRGDPAADLWLAAFMGASSGDPDLLRNLLSGASAWPEKLGFDLLDVDRHLTFGTPPSDGAVLIGTFEPAAIRAAHEARGFTATAEGDLDPALRCRGMRGGPAGRPGDRGPRPALWRRHRTERQPLSVSGRDLLVSADKATLDAMEAATTGEMASLAEDRAYRGLALAADPDLTLVQATILPGGMFGVGPDIYRILAGSPEAATELLARLADDFEPMPPRAGRGHHGRRHERGAGRDHRARL